MRRTGSCPNQAGRRSEPSCCRVKSGACPQRCPAMPARLPRSASSLGLPSSRLSQPFTASLSLVATCSSLVGLRLGRNSRMCDEHQSPGCPRTADHRLRVNLDHCLHTALSSVTHGQEHPTEKKEGSREPNSAKQRGSRRGHTTNLSNLLVGHTESLLLDLLNLLLGYDDPIAPLGRPRLRGSVPLDILHSLLGKEVGPALLANLSSLTQCRLLPRTHIG